MEKVTRTLHVPARAEENPVLTPDLPWEGSLILQPGTVIFDEDEHVFKMWYNSFATASKPDIQQLLLYATFEGWDSLGKTAAWHSRISRVQSK